MNSDMAQVLVQNRVSLALPVIPATGAERGHQRQEDVAHHADDRQPDLAERASRTAFISAIMRRSTSRTNWAGCRASRASPTWASAITACGPGSIRTSWRPSSLSGMDVVDAITQQNVQVAAGQIGQPPTTPGPAVSAHRSTRRAGSPIRSSSPTSSSRRGKAIARRRPLAASSGKAGSRLGGSNSSHGDLATGIVRLRDVVRENSYYLRIRFDPAKLAAQQARRSPRCVEALEPDAFRPRRSRRCRRPASQRPNPDLAGDLRRSAAAAHRRHRRLDHHPPAARSQARSRLGDLVVQTDGIERARIQGRSRACSSARSSTTSPAPSTANLPWPCPSISSPAPTPWTPPRAFTPR